MARRAEVDELAAARMPRLPQLDLAHIAEPLSAMRRAFLSFGLVLLAVACDSTSAPATPADVDVVDVDVDAGARDAAMLPDAGREPEVIEPVSSCTFPGVRSVETLATADPSGPRIRLRYRTFPSSRDGAPVVIVVPGGPGQSLVADDARRNFALGAVPTDDFTVIYVDARGSGCNELPALALPDADVYSIERVADDIATVIRAEALTEYYLYGASFGSAAATVAVSRMEARGEPLPRRLILEGVVGHAFASFDAYFEAFENEWSRVAPLLTPTWRETLGTEPFEDPLGWSRQQWGNFVAGQLILGDYPGNGHMLRYWLDGLTAETPAAERYVASFMGRIPAEGLSPPPGPLFRTIACRELWGGWRSDRELRDGALRAIGPDACHEGLVAPYDAAAHPSSVPTVYFHGPFDPTTTTEQAEHHFATRIGARREMVIVPNAAHAPLTVGLAARGCAREIWSAIAEDGALEPVLRACPRPDEVIELRSAATR